MPHAVSNGLFRVLALGVAPAGRDAWVASQQANVHAMCILADRGELVGSSFPRLARLYRRAFSDALGTFDLRRWMRGPAFPLAAAWLAVLLIAVLSHGLAETRALLNAFAHASVPANQNMLAKYLFPIVFALSTGLILTPGRIPLRGRHWPYVAFLLAKTLSLVAVAVLLWIEGGSALRHSIANPALRAIGGGLALAIVFIGSVGWLVLWSLADQQHRCSVCLRRLVLPVRMGSWGSVFDPAATEWICEDGHGALCEREVENGAPDRWIELECEVDRTCLS